MTVDVFQQFPFIGGWMGAANIKYSRMKLFISIKSIHLLDSICEYHTFRMLWVQTTSMLFRSFFIDSGINASNLAIGDHFLYAFFLMDNSVFYLKTVTFVGYEILKTFFLPVSSLLAPWWELFLKYLIFWQIKVSPVTFD